ISGFDCLAESRLYFVNLQRKSCIWLGLAGDGDVKAVQLGDQNRGPGAKSGWHIPNMGVMISVLLLKNGCCFCSRYVDTLALKIAPHVVVLRRARELRDDLARIGVKHKECRRLSRGDKHSMIRLIESQRVRGSGVGYRLEEHKSEMHSPDHIV